MNNQNTRRGSTQVIVGDNTLFTSPLEGEDVRRTEEGAWNKSFMAPPLPAFGHPLPQGARITTRGFTLIELLVVVLIIGILAAVALPQYQTAVDKVRLSTYLSILKNIRDAQEIYHLNNGEYAFDLQNLDIDISKICTDHYAGNMLFRCKDSLYINNQYLGVVTGLYEIEYCPDMTETVTASNYISCSRNATARIILTGNFHATIPAKIFCTHNGKARGKRICRWVEGQG